MKEKDSIRPPSGWTLKKKQKTVERKLTYEKTAEDLEEETAQYIKEQLKPKVPPPREKVPLEQGKKLLANLDNPPKPKSLPSDYDRTLTKAHKVRNLKKKMWQDHSLSWHTTKRTRAPPGARVATPTPDGRTTPGGPTGRDISF